MAKSAMIAVIWIVGMLLCVAPTGQAAGGKRDLPVRPVDHSDQATDVQLDNFRIQVSAGRVRVLRSGHEGDRLLELDTSTAWMQVGRTDLEALSHHGSFAFHSRMIASCQPKSGRPDMSQSDDALTLSWPITGDSAACNDHFVALEFKRNNPRRLGFKIYTDLADTNFIQFSAVTPTDESFHGFGLQPTFHNLKGKLVPIWTQEQGVARGRQPYSWVVNRAAAGAAGTPVTSYMAAPYFITNKRRGLFLKNKEYAEFDLTKRDVFSVRVYASEVNGELLSADRPLDLISAFTEYSGRMRRVPDWFHSGAIVGLQGGSQRVRVIWRKMRARGTPIAALWIQDWVGQRQTNFGQQLQWNWALDEKHYPGWDQLVKDLRTDGARMLGYINPHLMHIAPQGNELGRRHLYQEASAQGFLVKNSRGEDYMVQLGAIVAAMVDLANPDARIWIKNVIKDEIIARGFSGWMCDFSEALPPDGLLQGGIEGRDFHHRYVEEWAKVNGEAIQEAGIADDTVYFCRAGYTQSPGLSRFFWQGDQTVSWDHFDGLKSAVTGLIGGGISGYSLNHSDIGGYTGFNIGGIGLRRSHELLARWQEFSAFTPAFRTHEGLLPGANAQIYDNDEALITFDRNARIFASLHFYRKKLFADAEAYGYPVVRAMFLEFPDDPHTYDIHDQFMLGSELLVAPMLNPNQFSRAVYLPAGSWVHAWTGKHYGHPSQPSTVVVPAPIGEPPVFYKSGSTIEKDWAIRQMVVPSS